MPAAEIVSSSCEAVLGRGRCPLVSEVQPPSVVAWLAVVRAEQADPTDVVIEFRDWVERVVVINTRQLRFSPHDRPRSRWATVGTAIAAFVAARDGVPPAVERPQPLSVEPAAVGLPGPEPEPLWHGGADVAALSAPGLDRGAWRVGGLLRGWLGVRSTPLAFVAASVRYAERVSGVPRVAWWSAGLGPGVRLSGDELSGELLAEAAFERLLVTASDADGRSDDGVVARYGGRLGLLLGWAVAPPLELIVGGEVGIFRPSVDVVVAGQIPGRAPSSELGLLAGIRLAP